MAHIHIHLHDTKKKSRDNSGAAYDYTSARNELEYLQNNNKLTPEKKRLLEAKMERAKRDYESEGGTLMYHGRAVKDNSSYEHYSDETIIQKMLCGDTEAKKEAQRRGIDKKTK